MRCCNWILLITDVQRKVIFNQEKTRKFFQIYCLWKDGIYFGKCNKEREACRQSIWNSMKMGPNFICVFVWYVFVDLFCRQIFYRFVDVWLKFHCIMQNGICKILYLSWGSFFRFCCCCDFAQLNCGALSIYKTHRIQNEKSITDQEIKWRLAQDGKISIL